MRILTGKLLVAGVMLSLSVALYAAHRYQDEPDAQPLDALKRLDLGGTGPDAATQGDLYTRALARLEERLARHPDDYEASLLQSLIHFKQGRLGEALTELDHLTRRAPKFYLAHLIRGDLLLAQARTVTDIGAAPILGPKRYDTQNLNNLRQEAEARLKAYLNTFPQDRLPRSLLAMGHSVKTVLVVDKSIHRLYVYEQSTDGGPPHLLRDFYVSTGRLVGNKSATGDLRTPDGVYFVTSHIPENKLPDKYGAGAYPLNYPNAWDRHLGRTGYGIWLHGTENAFYSRPPLASEGCVVLPNLDLNVVGRYIRPGNTPVIITEKVHWLEAKQWQALRGQLLQAIEQWRSDWESLDVDRYIAHYSADFWSGAMNRQQWARRKRRIAAAKQYQHIKLDDISLFAYPKSGADRDMVVADFRQDYRSNNFSSVAEKRLYLALENGRWRILHEGTP